MEDKNQANLTHEPGWNRTERPAIELLKKIEADPDRKLAEFCLEGLKLAVYEKKMTAEQAAKYYFQWFGRDYESDEPAIKRPKLSSKTIRASEASKYVQDR